MAIEGISRESVYVHYRRYVSSPTSTTPHAQRHTAGESVEYGRGRVLLVHAHAGLQVSPAAGRLVRSRRVARPGHEGSARAS